MSQGANARATGYLFLVNGALAPFLTGLYSEHVSREHEARTGFPPDGMGLAGVMIIGGVVTFLLFLLATIFAGISFAKLESPRPLKRKIELALFCLPFAFIMLCCFGIWYVANHPEPRVYEFPVPTN